MQFPRPSLYLDFTRGVWPDLVKLTRTTAGSVFGPDGTMLIMPSGVLRLDHDPETSIPRGVLVEEARTNLFLNSLIDGTNLTTQDVTVTAQAYTVSFYGSGSITFSGAHVATLSGAGEYPKRVTLTFTPSAGTLTCTVTGDVKYAQIEAGAFATSFIPTAGAAATRAADVLSVATSAFPYNQNEGTLFCTANFAQASANSKFPNPIAAYEDVNNSIVVEGVQNTSSLYTVIKDGGVSQVAQTTGAFTAGTDVNIALAYAENDVAIGVDGEIAGEDTSCTIPDGIESLFIGTLSAAATQTFLNGHIKYIAYFQRRLADTDLQTLTR